MHSAYLTRQFSAWPTGTCCPKSSRRGSRRPIVHCVSFISGFLFLHVRCRLACRRFEIVAVQQNESHTSLWAAVSLIVGFALLFLRPIYVEDRVLSHVSFTVFMCMYVHIHAICFHRERHLERHNAHHCVIHFFWLAFLARWTVAAPSLLYAAAALGVSIVSHVVLPRVSLGRLVSVFRSTICLSVTLVAHAVCMML